MPSPRRYPPIPVLVKQQDKEAAQRMMNCILAELVASYLESLSAQQQEWIRGSKL